MARTVIYLTLICVLVFFISTNFGAPHGKGKDYHPRTDVVIGECIVTMVNMTEICNLRCVLNPQYEYGYCDENNQCRCVVK